MSLLDRIEKPSELEEIEPGKRLIVAGDDRGFSLAERFGLRLHFLTWRTPLHAMRLRGRYPLKLIAVPKDPIAGDKAAGEAILAGEIRFGGQSVALKALDFHDPSLSTELADHLQSFAWLRDLAAVAARERGAKLVEAATQRWLDQCGGHVSERSWRPDLWGRRILFWSAYAPYLLSSRDIVYRSAVLNGLARGARHLDRTASRATEGLPRIAAWAGLIAASLVVQGGPARRSRGEAGLFRALEVAMHDDGGLTSRSPTQQVALVELLSQLRAAYISVRREIPEQISEALDGAAAALASVRLGDGALSSWQGGHMLTSRRIAAAIEGAGVDSKAVARPRGWGYHRLAAKNSIAVIDAAPPPPARALSGGCASTLAFEFTDGKDRLIVNCGGAGEDRSSLPANLQRALRATAAHSTLTLGDRNSTAVLDSGGLGKGVTQVELARDDTAGVALLEARHDGYSRRFGYLHQRQLILQANGCQLDGEDQLIPSPRKRPKESLPFAVRFHLAPAVEITGTADGKGALLRIRGGGVWLFRARGGELAVEESLWIDGAAAPHPTRQLVVTGETPPEGITISWSLKRQG